MSYTFDSVAFLSSVEGDGNWADEFIAWYQSDQWLSEERACGAFLAGKFALASAIAGIPAEPAIKRYTHCEESFDSFEDTDGEWVLYEDHCAAIAVTTPAPADDVQALRAFAQAIMGDWPDVGGLDGFDLQQLGVKHGLLKPEIRFAPCCEEEEGCRCADGTDEDDWHAGITCYRKTPLLIVHAPAAQPLTEAEALGMSPSVCRAMALFYTKLAENKDRAAIDGSINA